MRLLRLLIVLMLVALVATGCAGPFVTPPSGPGTDWPCGLQDHQCHNGACCWADYDCGDLTPGCPADACCYGGPSNTFKTKPGAKPRPERVSMRWPHKE